MKAAVYTQYGNSNVVTIQNINKPEITENQVLVKIKKTSVTSGDYRLRKADPFEVRFFSGLLKPKHNILGHEFSGVIEETGSSVTKFKKGDRVFGSADLISGTHAEFMAFSENDILVHAPEDISDDHLAVTPVGALTAKHFLDQMGDLKGKKIMIYGAAGSVGTYAIQLAKIMGAEVTAVTSSKKSEAVKSIGADHVIDYKKTDMSKLNEKYDLLFDAVGLIKNSFINKILIKNGVFATVAINPGILIHKLFNSETTKIGVTKQSKENLEIISEYIKRGLINPVIDREFEFDQIRSAHDYVEKGSKLGNVLISIN